MVLNKIKVALYIRYTYFNHKFYLLGLINVIIRYFSFMAYDVMHFILSDSLNYSTIFPTSWMDSVGQVSQNKQNSGGASTGFTNIKSNRNMSRSY